MAPSLVQNSIFVDFKRTLTLKKERKNMIIFAKQLEKTVMFS